MSGRRPFRPAVFGIGSNLGVARWPAPSTARSLVPVGGVLFPALVSAI